ncbi:MFS transporter [Pigmentiphaga soli]|uniref:MFS transporter n=1 Tax=Pigmentiphaga soli TaxID=1007095 RepID=A0ABP8GKA6_9BURK
MFAQTLSLWLDRRGIHFAWIVAAITFLTMLTTAAALGTPSALLPSLVAEFGWNTEQVSSALALRFALFGLMAPFSALLIDRFGLRAVVCSALLMIGAGMGLVTGVTAIWQLFALWGVVLGIGSGMTAQVLGALVSNRWFTQRRGLVIGILTASSATGQLLFLPAAAWLSDHYGWRAAVLPLCTTCLVVAGLVLCFMRDRPASVGLAPYGEPPGTAAAAAPARPMRWTAPFTVLAEAARNRVFWVLAATFFICGLSTSGLIQTHFISLCGDYGLSAVPAASVLAMMGAFDFVGTIMSGWLSDRYDSRKLLFWYYGLRGLSLFWLPHSEFTLTGLSLFAMFYGLDWIATVPPTVRLATAEFGRERAPMVFGWIFAAHQLGSAAAAYGAGAVRTALLTYNPALYAAGLACLLAAAIVFVIRRRPALAA